VGQSNTVIKQPQRWLDKLFPPASVAVVGASSDPERKGGRLIGCLLRAGPKGWGYRVNPNRDAAPRILVLTEQSAASVKSLENSPILLRKAGVAALDASILPRLT